MKTEEIISDAKETMQYLLNEGHLSVSQVDEFNKLIELTKSTLSENGKLREEQRTTLIHFLDRIKEYERDNGNKICYDDRESSELVDIYYSTIKVD